MAEDIQWPRDGDKLIDAGMDWPMNACLNFMRGGHMEGYADGYNIAGDVLVKHVAEKLRDQDKLVYPAMFAYRHYVELRLKY